MIRFLIENNDILIKILMYILNYEYTKDFGDNGAKIVKF